MISTQHIAKALSYSAFNQLNEQLIKEGKTTGTNQSAEFVEYGRVNYQRMSRVYKTTVLSQELLLALDALKKNYTFLVITEGWCGDSAQIVPVFERMCEHSNKLDLKFLLRDENSELMDAYLTNGARSIPKLICIDRDTLEEKFVWGPRPAALQAEVTRLLAAHVSKEEKGLFVQKWYNENKTAAIQQEMAKLLQGL